MEVVAPLIGLDWTFLMVLVTFAVLYLILKKYFFEKLRNFMQAREQKVKDQFDNAAAANKQAETLLSEYKTQIADVEAEKREILKEGKQLAEQRAKAIVDEANERASEIKKQAEREIEREKKVAMETMKDQVALLAIYAAEKIIEQKLGEKEQQFIIDDIIKDASVGTWNH
ncbi:MAG: F0F1 ATP synthase subunit B [Clostridiales Family XIII bacterium]|jgi:F-type H+-transporting ATPase subunit b|nr:F0F1 ATP synthase subunit B [Clostridiales Family XIII bacterium]